MVSQTIPPLQRLTEMETGLERVNDRHGNRLKSLGKGRFKRREF